jgi:peptide/nickel transport system permease protein
MNLYLYILRRVLYTIPTIIGVTFFIFVMFNLVAGDPAKILLGKYASAKQIAELRHELGLDKPFVGQYLDVLKSALTFNFGNSWSSKQSISHMLKNSGMVSLSLSLPGFLLGNVLAICIAFIAVVFRGTWIDKMLVVLCTLLVSISALTYILLGQWFFSYKLGWFEINGYEYGFPNFIPYIILPSLILMILNIGYDMRFYRAVLLEEIYKDYVRTAMAKGLSLNVVLFKHVLRNALIPILTNIFMNLPSLILGTLLLENFFSIPGLGGVLIKAIGTSDFPVIKATTIVVSILYIVFNLLIDLLYMVADPRVKLK